jgi:hypothetical protein
MNIAKLLCTWSILLSITVTIAITVALAVAIAIAIAKARTPLFSLLWSKMSI